MCAQLIKSIAFSLLGMLVSWAAAQQCFDAGLNVQSFLTGALRIVLDMLAASGQF